MVLEDLSYRPLNVLRFWYAPPDQFQSELNLSRGCQHTRDCPSRARGFRARTGRGKGNQIWRVEIRALEQVEDLHFPLPIRMLAAVSNARPLAVPADLTPNFSVFPDRTSSHYSQTVCERHRRLALAGMLVLTSKWACPQKPPHLRVFRC